MSQRCLQHFKVRFAHNALLFHTVLTQLFGCRDLDAKSCKHKLHKAACIIRRVLAPQLLVFGTIGAECGCFVSTLVTTMQHIQRISLVFDNCFHIHSKNAWPNDRTILLLPVTSWFMILFAFHFCAVDEMEKDAARHVLVLQITLFSVHSLWG